MNKTIIHPKNLDAFRIWVERLGYTVKDFPNGGFQFRFKKKEYGLVTNTLSGNPLATRLGKEFEEHLRA